MMLLAGRKKTKGFSLLEVMVSVAILSVCLVLILGSFLKSVKAMDLSEDYFRAGLLLEEKIYEVSNSDIEEGFSTGMFSNFNNRFSWDLNVRKSEEESFHEVNLRVSWNQGTRQHDFYVPMYL